MCQRTNLLLPIRGQELFKEGFRGVQVEGGGYVWNSTDSPKSHLEISRLFSSFFFFCLFAISWAAPVAYGGSQAKG